MQEASAVEQGNRIPWGWVVGTAVGLEVAMIVLAVAWVAIYSYLIHPGEEPAYYQNYAQKSSPVVSVVLGMPLWYLAFRWVGRKAGTRAVAMSVWAWFILVLIEFPLYLMSELTAYEWMMVSISLSTKLLAAYLGGRAALKSIS